MIGADGEWGIGVVVRMDLHLLVHRMVMPPAIVPQVRRLAHGG